jgi:linoleoyl-CoA desaturase
MGGTIYILAETCTTGRYNTMYYTTPTRYSGHDEDLDAGRIIRFTKEAKWHSFHRFQQYYLCFIWLLTFNWAITTDFRQMKTYLKENYPTVKKKAKTLWTTLIITKVIYVSIWIVLPIVIGLGGKC